MSETLGVREAEARFSELVERAVAGEDIVITKGGEAVAKIVAVKQSSLAEKVGKNDLGEIAATLAALRGDIAKGGSGQLELSTVLSWRNEGRH